MKKNNTAEKTIQEAEKITKALKEGTEKSIRAIIDEAVAKLVQEGCNEEDEEDGYSVEDVNTDDTSAAEETPAIEDGGDAADEGDAEGGENDGEEGGEPEDADNAEDDTWADLEDYKVGDNDYDFTGVNGDEILKVYNKLGDDDQIFVKKEEDGVYSVKDDETGAEFVIELDPYAEQADAEDADAESGEEFDEEGEGLGDESDNEFEFELGDDEDGTEGDEDENFGGEDGIKDEDEIELDINNDDDDNELNEDLGYTDSYQKDVFAKKPNMNEPADSKTTNDWDAGAPKGSEKPWAGKGDTKPFEKKVNECGTAENAEEANLEEDGNGLNTKHSMKKTQNRLNKDAKNQKVVSQNGEYKGNIEESVKKIVAKARAIQAENKQYAAMVSKIKQSLYEAAVLNVNLGKLVDILVNETTTKDEKKKICERFNNAKTIAEGKALYNTIKSELNETKSSVPAIEKQLSATPSKILNETTIYQNNESNAALSLMERMDNLFKK